MQARRLEGKIALVTGSARGIGAAIAERFAREGAVVWMADIDAAANAAAAARLSNVVVAEVDIASDLSVANLAKEIESKHGHLDVLVNNAAILDIVRFEDLTASHTSKILEINLNGAVRVTLAMVPLLKKSKGTARILNIGSVNGLRGTPDNIPYSIAKGGITNLTRCLAVDLGQFGINVNALAPGFIDTRMSIMPDGTHEHKTEVFNEIYIKNRRIPLRRGGKPEDLAGPALFLCSEDANYVSGQILTVDGGMLSTF